MKWRVRMLLVMMPAWSLVPVAPGRADTLEEPFLDGKKVIVEYYGDADNVRLLAALLQEADPLVREQAVRGLAETHNLSAVAHLRGAMKDPDPLVRAAVASAAAELPPAHGAEFVIAALDSPDRPVVLAALRSTRRMKLASARAKLEKLLTAQDTLLQAVSLHTLTALAQAAPAERLAELLQSPAMIVRLRAAENALVFEDGAALIEGLARLASEDAPAVRGTALAVLGQLAFAKAEPLLGKARRHPSGLVRRGAVLAYAHAAQADKIRPFLDDPSPAVRLAAIESAGKLKCDDCVGRLFEILLTARNDLAHDQARISLANIAAADIAGRATATLKDLYPRLLQARKLAEPKEPRPTEPPVRTEEIRLLERNVASCCRLLGQLKSTAGMDTLLALAGSEKFDSPVMAGAAEALGRIGDKRAGPALMARMPQCLRLAKRHLQEQMSMQPVYVPFDEDIAGQYVAALAELPAAEGMDQILKLAMTKVASLRLRWAAVCAIRAALTMTDESNRDRVGRAILNMLPDRSYYPTARFVLAKAAGRLKLPAATPALETILNKDRPGRQVMHAAAWAIQQITGAAPRVPAPNLRQGRWIIVKPGS